jgi:integrase
MIRSSRRARWVRLPDDLFAAIVERLPAREDRDHAAPLVDFGSTDALRVAIGRACRDAGIPVFSPHDLRHRRISLLHQQGESWAEIGAKVGQHNISTTADTYSHVLMDYRELNRSTLLERARIAHTPVHTPVAETASLAGMF